VYTFGAGEHGQLGLGVSTKLALSPLPIITTTPLTEDGAVAVAAGGEHCLIQMKTGKTIMTIDKPVLWWQ
jgi:alpha-tubulin suppressor-like RCC1 family protein